MSGETREVEGGGGRREEERGGKDREEEAVSAQLVRVGSLPGWLGLLTPSQSAVTQSQLELANLTVRK